MKAEKMSHRGFCLPDEFLDKDFFAVESRGVAGKGETRASILEAESDEDDYTAGLSQQMARSSLIDEKSFLAFHSKSTLNDVDMLSSSSSGGSPNGPSQLSTPSSTPFEAKKNELDLLYAAAGEVLRLKQNEQGFYVNGLLRQPSPTCALTKSPAILTHQQFKFYHLKQQQLITQQLSDARSRQSRVAVEARKNRSLGGVSLACPPRTQQSSSGMRSVLFNRTRPLRESTGTGVFLPRRICSNESRKKPACSSILLPPKVIHALNLQLHDTGVHTCYAGSLDNGLSKPYKQALPAVFSGEDVRLAKEWAY